MGYPTLTAAAGEVSLNRSNMHKLTFVYGAVVVADHDNDDDGRQSII